MVGPSQLVQSGAIDYLVFDYLAETTMAILAAAKAKNASAGYATDFVEIAMKDVLRQGLRDGVKFVANAGGINPKGCAEALRAMSRALGASPKIAVVQGDDVSAMMPSFRERGVRDMFSGGPLPESVLSANAYLGALPVATALAAGADVVITGRGVDSAVTLGPLIHEFGWSANDFDRLAGGSLAGHIIECGCQATGGLHTDWELVPDWPNIGYPIVECRSDGSFTVTKPRGTGGIVRTACVAEQMLYEIGDPGAYLLPDVTCDFREVTLTQVDDEHVLVEGAKGRPPTGSYKVSATALKGYRCAGSMVIVGIDAAAKARRTGEAIIARTRRIFRELGFADFTNAKVELLGAEALYGPHARTAHVREAMVRVVVDHPEKKALEVFAREIAPSGTSWSPGTTSPGGGRPSPSPLITQFSFLVPKTEISVEVSVDGVKADLGLQHSDCPATPPSSALEPEAWAGSQDEPMIELPLVKLAWARSGDKGNISNIGVIARRPEWLPFIWLVVTPDVVKAYFAHLMTGAVERYYVPGIHAVNFLLHESLSGGGPASTRIDPLGKGMAQMLLDLTIKVPKSIAAQISN
jgi:hypothetical protein